MADTLKTKAAAKPRTTKAEKPTAPAAKKSAAKKTAPAQPAAVKAAPSKAAVKKIVVKKQAVAAKPRAEVVAINAGAAPQAPEMPLSFEQVARLAHQFWIERGRVHGRHEEDWLRAEQALRSKAS